MIKLLQSSTGVGVKLRITSFALLLVPVVNNYLLTDVNLAPEAVEQFIDASFVVLFGIAQAWGWIRSWMKK